MHLRDFLAPELKVKILVINMGIEVVPGRMTLKLQMLDVNVLNKPKTTTALCGEWLLVGE